MNKKVRTSDESTLLIRELLQGLFDLRERLVLDQESAGNSEIN